MVYYIHTASYDPPSNRCSIGGCVGGPASDGGWRFRHVYNGFNAGGVMEMVYYLPRCGSHHRLLTTMRRGASTTAPIIEAYALLQLVGNSRSMAPEMMLYATRTFYLPCGTIGTALPSLTCRGWRSEDATIAYSQYQYINMSI